MFKAINRIIRPHGCVEMDKPVTETARAAMSWISSLPLEEQRAAGAYYSHTALAAAIFDYRLGFERLHQIGGEFCGKAFLFDEPEYDITIAENLDRVTRTLDSQNIDFAVVTGIIPSARFTDAIHMIAIKIDKNERRIDYQDPQGDEARDDVRTALGRQFQGYRFVDHHIAQQRDNFSCAMIALYDCMDLARNRPLDPNINDRLPDLRAEDSLVVLPTLSMIIARELAKPSDETAREKWQSAARAVRERKMDLYPPDLPMAMAANFLMRLTGAPPTDVA